MFGVSLNSLIGKFWPSFVSPARKLSVVPLNAMGMYAYALPSSEPSCDASDRVVDECDGRVSCGEILDDVEVVIGEGGLGHHPVLAVARRLDGRREELLEAVGVLHVDLWVGGRAAGGLSRERERDDDRIGRGHVGPVAGGVALTRLVGDDQVARVCGVVAVEARLGAALVGDVAGRDQAVALACRVVEHGIRQRGEVVRGRVVGDRDLRRGQRLGLPRPVQAGRVRRRARCRAERHPDAAGRVEVGGRDVDVLPVREVGVGLGVDGRAVRGLARGARQDDLAPAVAVVRTGCRGSGAAGPRGG